MTVAVLRVRVKVTEVDVDGAGALDVIGGPLMWLTVDHDDFGPVLRWPRDERDTGEVQHGKSPASPAGTPRDETMEGRDV